VRVVAEEVAPAVGEEPSDERDHVREVLLQSDLLDRLVLPEGVHRAVAVGLDRAVLGEREAAEDALGKADLLGVDAPRDAGPRRGAEAPGLPVTVLVEVHEGVDPVPRQERDGPLQALEEAQVVLAGAPVLLLEEVGLHVAPGHPQPHHAEPVLGEELGVGLVEAELLGALGDLRHEVHPM
jgi:hypothetical protein